MRFLLLLLAIVTGATGVVGAHASAPRQVASAGLEAAGGVVRRADERSVAMRFIATSGHARARPIALAMWPQPAIALWTMRRRE